MSTMNVTKGNSVYASQLAILVNVKANNNNEI